jgi:hypothetical protein
MRKHSGTQALLSCVQLGSWRKRTAAAQHLSGGTRFEACESILPSETFGCASPARRCAPPQPGSGVAWGGRGGARGQGAAGRNAGRPGTAVQEIASSPGPGPAGRRHRPSCLRSRVSPSLLRPALSLSCRRLRRLARQPSSVREGPSRQTPPSRPSRSSSPSGGEGLQQTRAQSRGPRVARTPCPLGHGYRGAAPG